MQRKTLISQPDLGMPVHMGGDGGEEGGEGVLGEFVAGVGQNSELGVGDVFGQGLAVGEGEEWV
jgi:hypothetical protein